MPNSTAPVTVGWYLHPLEAEIARGKLESEGIPAFLHSSNHSQLDWPMTLALGGIRLQVPPSAAQEAMEILASVEPESNEISEIVCPDCGSKNIESKRTSWRIAVLAVHLLSLPLPFLVGKKRCRACGVGWEGD